MKTKGRGKSTNIMDTRPLKDRYSKDTLDEIKRRLDAIRMAMKVRYPKSLNK